MTHLFIKLRSKLRAILINYQNLSIIKKRLLILTCRLKINMKKIVDAQATFDNCSNDFKSANSKRKKKDDIKNDRKSQNDESKNKRDLNVDSKKRKRSNHFKLICHICQKMNHISLNCLDLKKAKMNAVSNKLNESKKSKKEKSSVTTDQSLKTKNL